MSYIPEQISEAFSCIDTVTPSNTGLIRSQVEAVLADLDKGILRVAYPSDPDKSIWETNSWIKQAILLYFRLRAMDNMADAGYRDHWDKIPLKTTGWSSEQFSAAGFRMVPGSVVRYGAYIAPHVVIMPSFINIGAYIDQGCMIDTWATVGSCAQIGRNVHISGGAGIGGVLEPLQAQPTIIEDDCFIGARSEIAEGVVIERGSVLSMGVFISASTPVIDRSTDKIYRGRVPAGSVVVPGCTTPKQPGKPSLYAAVIVKTVDMKTRKKVGINQLLRDAEDTRINGTS